MRPARVATQSPARSRRSHRRGPSLHEPGARRLACSTVRCRSGQWLANGRCRVDRSSPASPARSWWRIVCRSAGGAKGKAVGAAHAGWRGLAGGRGRAARSMRLCKARRASRATSWPGSAPASARDGSRSAPTCSKPSASLPRHAQQRASATNREPTASTLARRPGRPGSRPSASIGVARVSGGRWCTVDRRSRFFSFRRDGVTGRMAACIWIRG